MNASIRIAAAIAAVSAAAATGSFAQNIEITSPSVGTVVVTPPPINGASAQGNLTAGRTGVDLGVQRRPDGSLYDPLAPAQNPAQTVVAPRNGEAPIANRAGVPESAGSSQGNPAADANAGRR